MKRHYLARQIAYDHFLHPLCKCVVSTTQGGMLDVDKTLDVLEDLICNYLPIDQLEFKRQIKYMIENEAMDTHGDCDCETCTSSFWRLKGLQKALEKFNELEESPNDGAEGKET